MSPEFPGPELLQVLREFADTQVSAETTPQKNCCTKLERSVRRESPITCGRLRGSPVQQEQLQQIKESYTRLWQEDQNLKIATTETRNIPTSPEWI